MFKRFLSLLLAGVMVLSMVPPKVHAEETVPAITVPEITVPETTAETQFLPATEGETTAPAESLAQTVPPETVGSNIPEAVETSGQCGDSAYWSLGGDGVLTISGTGDMWDFESWGRLAPPWVDVKDRYNEVVIQDGITRIGDCAFIFNYNLKYVTMADTVTSIGYSAFADSSELTMIMLSANLVRIEEHAFSGCTGLPYLIFDSKLTTIEEYAFSGCTGLTDVTLSKSVSSIGEQAFGYCDNLEAIYVDPENAHYSGDANGVLFNKRKTELLMTPPKLSGAYTIPNGVTTIGKKAFYGCESLTGLTIPEGVTSIGESAFVDCSKMTSITIPNSVTSFGDYLFTGCESLHSVTIPGKLTHISSYAFQNCKSLKTLTIPGNITSIGSGAFTGCDGLTSLDIPDSVKTIGDSAFYRCSGLTSVTLPSGLTQIDDLLFAYCKKLATVEIPGNVTSIGSSAFMDCTGLLEMTIPGSVSVVDYSAFYGCTGLLSIFFKGNAPSFAYNAFSKVIASVYYPADNATWTSDVRQNYEGNITWIAGDAEDAACRLADLKPLDYLAFAEIAYQNFRTGETVEECLTRKGKWNKVWGEDDITYAELCSNIADWTVCKTKDLDTKNGFYGVAFRNDNQEVVISYRGSVPPNEFSANTALDAAWDWLVSDLRMQLLNVMEDETQNKSAAQFYEEAKKDLQWRDVALTGHSLGGGLAQIVSARYGCKAVTMNSISVLDAAYEAMPKEMGKHFVGVDKWNFVDHTNMFDILAGMWEHYTLAPKVKPYVAHYSNNTVEIIGGTIGLQNNIGEVFSCHSLSTIVHRDKEGIPVIRAIHSTYTRDKAFSNSLDHFRHVNLGTSGSNIFTTGLGESNNETSYGGSGNDGITADSGIDRLIGGRGNDTLDGGWGNDFYIYFKGDGVDTIHDTSGEDTLYLNDFSDHDTISIYEGSKDSKYIEVKCNGTTIVKIDKDGRAYKKINTDYFRVSIMREDGLIDVYNITDMFHKDKYGSRVLVGCPVDVEVLDPEGNVVFTLKDGEVGNHYTEYGNFYVFEEENGEFGKLLELREGYTSRIVGKDSGTMDVSYQSITDGELEAPKSFTEIPVSAAFTATFEQKSDGELVLTADTDGDNTVDTEISPVAVESISIDQKYLALEVGGEPVSLSAVVAPAEMAAFLEWQEEDEMDCIDLTEDGKVTAKAVGTAYVKAVVSEGGTTLTARCRIDVAAMDEAEPEKIKIAGVQLGSQKATSELYSTDYARLEVLLKLPQNIDTSSLEDKPAKGSVAIDSARFVGSRDSDEMNRLFDLVPLDDRRLAVVPRAEIVRDADEAKKVKGSYKSIVEVTVDGTPHFTGELTLTVKKSTPKPTGKVEDFNSYYSGQSREILITGGTVVSIAEDESGNKGKTTAIPDWLDLEDGILTLKEDAPLKNASGKVCLLVETEEWRIPAAVSVNVKNSYKAPGLKLSASNVTFTSDWEASSGAVLKLQPKTAKDSLTAMKITGIADPDGFVISGFSSRTGEFTLKPTKAIVPDKITLNVTAEGTTVTVPLTLKVKTAEPALKLSTRSVTLNTAVDDSAVIGVTPVPADHILTDQDVVPRVTDSKNNGTDDVTALWNPKTGTVTVKAAKEAAGTYKVYVGLPGGKETAVTVRIVHQEPTVTVKAAGTLDLSFPDTPITVTPTFRNYSGEIVDYSYTISEMNGKTVVKEHAEDLFTVERSGSTFLVWAKKGAELNVKNGYALNLELELAGGKKLPGTVSLKAKRTAVKLKLSTARVTLNKKVNDGITVDVSCATKGYTLQTPYWELKDKTGKTGAEGELTIQPEGNVLHIAVNDSTKYGATYKLLVKADQTSAAQTLTITVPAENKSSVTSALKAKGGIDVIRDSSAVTLTPTYQNCSAEAEKKAELVFYKTVGRTSEEVEGLFVYTANADGSFTVTKQPGAKLDHSGKYTVKLVAEINGKTTTESKPVALSVKMGTAKLTLTAKDSVLFAQDAHDRLEFRIDSGDKSLNGVEKLTVKDKKYVDLLEVYDYGNGAFAVGFRDAGAAASLAGKNITVNLDVLLKGNVPAKVNATLRLKVTVLP